MLQRSNLKHCVQAGQCVDSKPVHCGARAWGAVPAACDEMLRQRWGLHRGGGGAGGLCSRLCCDSNGYMAPCEKMHVYKVCTVVNVQSVGVRRVFEVPFSLPHSIV